MEKLVILDYSIGEVHIYDVHPDTDIDEDFIKNLGFSIATTSWMFSERISIIHHNEIL